MLKKYFPEITIEKACNGELAIQKMGEQLQIKNLSNQYSGYQFKLIIMDINMPVMNGIDATKKISNMFNSKQYPIMPFVIAYTGHSDVKTR